jgi:uncharacterized membrane protein
MAMTTAMSGNDFLEQLKRQLRGLPLEELNAAVDYYAGYISDAGEENEAAAVAGLGAPSEVAAHIVAEFAVKPADSSEALTLSAKKGMNKVWSVILAIFAAPIALPIAVSAAAVAFALLVSLFAVYFSFAAAGMGMVAGGLAYIVLGVLVIFQDIPTALLLAGCGLFAFGLGALLTRLIIKLSRASFNALARVFGRFILRRTAR